MNDSEMEPKKPPITGNSTTPPIPRSPGELRSLGGYRLLRRIGEGGMGVVYLGFKEGEEEPIAIKVLNESLTSIPGFVDRFYREAENGIRLHHPHLVRTHKVAQDQKTGLHFLLMEYVDGPSAMALINRHGFLSPADAIYVILGVSRGLKHAHFRHIIHRDIKPDNILMNRSGVPKLADLGLSKNREEASSITQVHQTFGTTLYMPYEQAVNSKEADERSDIYALGITFYQLVTGSVPFFAASELDVIQKKKEGVYAPAESIRSEIPEEVDRILRRMLARNPDRRFQSASELIRALIESRLVPRRPSFCQEDLSTDSLTGPLVDSNAPTRLNLEIPEIKKGSSKPEEQVWYLVYRDTNGNLCKRRENTRQIIRGLRSGRIPRNSEVRKQGEKVFTPLLRFPEFNLSLAKPGDALINPADGEALPPG